LVDIIEDQLSFVDSWEKCERGEVGEEALQHLCREGGTKTLHPEKGGNASETGKPRLGVGLAVMSAFHC